MIEIKGAPSATVETGYLDSDRRWQAGDLPTYPSEIATGLLTVRYAGSPARDEVLPCPFCRCGTVSVCTTEGHPSVECLTCGARGPLARSDAHSEAIANWNRRPAMPELDQRTCSGVM